MGTSTTTTAQPWLLLPTRTISPLRMYQSTPRPSRIVVIRSPTDSTVPLASPTSTTSPTPYWSSMSMKMPDRKSRTRFCAPNPTATPTMPAPAMSGPRLRPSSDRAISVAMLRVWATIQPAARISTGQIRRNSSVLPSANSVGPTKASGLLNGSSACVTSPPCLLSTYST